MRSLVEGPEAMEGEDREPWKVCGEGQGLGQGLGRGRARGRARAGLGLVKLKTYSGGARVRVEEGAQKWDARQHCEALCEARASCFARDSADSKVRL